MFFLTQLFQGKISTTPHVPQPSPNNETPSVGRLLLLSLFKHRNRVQSSEDERKRDTTRFEDEIRRLQTEIEETRASVGPLMSLPESSKQALGSISGLDTVLEECMICRELLLSGIGKASFGVMSYSCGCSHVRTLHVNCVVSMANLNCPFCSERIVVIAPSLMAQTLVRPIPVRKTQTASRERDTGTFR